MNKINPELKIKELLDDLRPFLNGDGGDIEFIKYEDKFVYIKLVLVRIVVFKMKL